MSYQPQIAVSAVPTPTKPMSKWWWIGLLISCIILIGIGGGLIAAGENSCLDYDDACLGSDSLYYGAYACFAIGGILHLAYWILLIIWLTKRRRARAAVMYVDSSAVQEGKPFLPQQPAPTYTTLPTYLTQQHQFIPQPSPTPTSIYHSQAPGGTTTTSTQEPTMRRFCGNCGAATTTTFCTQCGARG